MSRFPTLAFTTTHTTKIFIDANILPIRAADVIACIVHGSFYLAVPPWQKQA